MATYAPWAWARKIVFLVLVLAVPGGLVILPLRLLAKRAYDGASVR